ncbi:MAG TPA: signal recognition particle protein [Pseudobdellovibrionaceae bacterium]|nr:signal recognition particle protein [Pseudobdellovibrionaceae bacterium]
MAIFESLSDRLLGSLKKLRGQSKISEENIQAILREIRLSLLEADVNFNVVKSFIDNVKAKSIGTNVLQGVEPGQQFVKIVHDELVSILGGDQAPLDVKGDSQKPGLIMMVGLQGAGKTTTSAKLALHIRQKFKKKPGLIPADVYRPAAIEQLKMLGTNLNVPVYPSSPADSPEVILQKALVWAREQMCEVLILDTAGRSQIDDALMGELEKLKNIAEPREILLVADAMLGQQSVNVAEGFHKRLSLTGLVLTKVDGDARGGAALSIRQATGVPIKFLGIGEKSDALEVFHPDRLASRILDMGDVLSLVEKAQEVIDEKQAMESAKKIAKNQFTMDDFLAQLQMLKKMGGLSSILGMLPGAGQMMKQLEGQALPDRELKKIEAIIRSMTKEERADHRILNGSRRARIARGSGTEVSDINKFIKQFEQSQKMMSQMMKMGLGRGGGMPGMPGMPGMGRGRGGFNPRRPF